MKPAYTAPALLATIRTELNGNARRDLMAQGRRAITSKDPAEVARGRLILKLAKEPRT